MTEREGTILVVDDEEPVRDIASEILKYLGYSVIAVGSGEEAERLMREGARPDLVILDVIMPGWSGAKTLLALREIDPELPILISTGFSDRAARDSLIQEGADGFVPKPYGISTLSRALETRAGRRLKNLR
jgi:two-component system, cell cycle sensor histidine kinase and response regulator CckA